MDWRNLVDRVDTFVIQ